jgi:hypothetical protein
VSAKANHLVSGTVDGRRFRARLSPGGSGWVLPVRLCAGVAIGDDVAVELAPGGPQRGDLADDIAAVALTGSCGPTKTGLEWAPPERQDSHIGLI